MYTYLNKNLLTQNNNTLNQYNCDLVTTKDVPQIGW